MRFLTPDAKEEILAEWDQKRELWRKGSLRGTGEPDADIIPWCDRINALPGVCTLQSCAGHVKNGTIETAHLWLWMSETAAKVFDREVFALLGHRERIDWISKHYLHDGKEITAVTFCGNERDLLASSLDLIYGFIRDVVDG